MSEIKNNPDVLDRLWNDMMEQDDLHRPGPYWERKMRNTYRLIKRDGLKNFRSNGVGISFADNPPVDILDQYEGSRLRHVLPFIRRVPLFSQVLGGQRFWAQANFDRAAAAEAKLFALQAGHWLDEMLEEFPNLPRGTEEGCKLTVEWRGESFSSYYLVLLSYIDVIRKSGVDFTRVETIMEVGGGLGANLHILLTLFPNIKRAVLVDVPPVLYVSGQYLQKFFPGVRSYKALKEGEIIQFSEDKSQVEVIAVPPWQLPHLVADLDLGWNSNSFVEMKSDQVRFYLEEIFSRLRINGDMVMVSYDNTDGGSLSLTDLLEIAENSSTMSEIDGESWGWLWSERVFRCSPKDLKI